MKANGEMKKTTQASIPFVAVVFLTVSNSAFFWFVFVYSKILSFDLNTVGGNLTNIVIATTPPLLLSYAVYLWSRRWQRQKLGRAIKLKAVPFVEQIPYMVSFGILYVSSAFTVDFINLITKEEYFQNSYNAFFMAFGLMAAITVRSWDVFIQHYWSEPQKDFRSSDDRLN